MNILAIGTVEFFSPQCPAVSQILGLLLQINIYWFTKDLELATVLSGGSTLQLSF